MAIPAEAPLPPDLDLGPGFTLRVTALAVSDGSVVSAVQASNFSVLLDDQGGTVDVAGLAVGPYLLVPGPGA